MKKALLLLPVLLLMMSFASCGGPSGEAAPEVIIFTDNVLEEKIREAMDRPEGDITVAEAEAVISLDLSNESFDDMNLKNGGIKDISDLKYFTGLEDLNLSYNDFHDLSPLAQLTSLKSLGFTGVSAEDLSVLRDLTNMTCMIFDWTCNGEEGVRQKGDISLDFLSDMKNLEIFSACGGGIKDITALGDLTKIWSLFLDDNSISDITVLSNLTDLRELKISNNLITDFSPLKDIYPNLEFVDIEM
ncbi:MAG: leucine-rich repeat domain-containing protein [Clostridiales bacterium]|nr:leucine-rich repeat domain-containing protein [Clostridiales bacterium]